jgi:hypothetical protein
MDPIRSLSRRSSQSEGGSIGVYSRLFSSLWLRLCRVVFFCDYSLSVLMRIVVLGLWHLGCVTAACAAKFESVVALDLVRTVVPRKNLQQKKIVTLKCVGNSCGELLFHG